MTTLILTVVSLFIFFPIIGNTSEIVSPALIQATTAVSTEESKTLYDKVVLFVEEGKDKNRDNDRVQDALQVNLNTDFSANNLLKEITKSGDIVIYCNDVKCLRSSKARKLAANWEFTSTFYFRDDLAGWKMVGFPVE